MRWTGNPKLYDVCVLHRFVHAAGSANNSVNMHVNLDTVSVTGTCVSTIQKPLPCEVELQNTGLGGGGRGGGRGTKGDVLSLHISLRFRGTMLQGGVKLLLQRPQFVSSSVQRG